MRTYFVLFSDWRANVDPVSALDWTLLALPKLLTRIRDEREVRMAVTPSFSHRESHRPAEIYAGNTIPVSQMLRLETSFFIVFTFVREIKCGSQWALRVNLLAILPSISYITRHSTFYIYVYIFCITMIFNISISLAKQNPSLVQGRFKIEFQTGD